MPEVQRRVDLRMERQKVLDRESEPLQIWSVLDEAALRRPVGSPEIMRAQLRHLVRLAERPTIDLQVLPLARGAHAGLDGTFDVLDFPLELPGDPGTVYVQGDAIDQPQRAELAANRSGSLADLPLGNPEVA